MKRLINIAIILNCFNYGQVPDSYDDYSSQKDSAKPINQNSLSVLFDKTSPDILSLKIKTDNIEDQYAKMGDRVTVYCEASETILDIKVLLYDKEIDVRKMNAREFVANHVIESDDSDGILPLNISFKDSAGNVLENFQSTTDGSFIIVDKTPPSDFKTDSVIAIDGNILPNIWNSTNNSLKVVVPIADDTTLVEGTAAIYAKIGLGDWEILGSEHNIEKADISTNKQIIITEDMLEAISGFDNGKTVVITSILVDKVGNETYGSESENKILIDQTLPTLSRIDIESTNLFPSVAKVGDTVNIKFIADEAIEPPKFNIYGSEIIAINTEHFDWLVTYIIQEDDSEGYVSFSYQPIKDVNGNPEKKDVITEKIGFTGDTTIVYQSGDMFSGRWKEGIIDGYGSFSWKKVGNYKGSWMNGKRNGYGTMVYNSGSRYEGEWRDDNYHGEGTYYYANGDIYSGEWRNGLKYGQGTYEWKSGNTYRGAWINDNYTNKGIMTFSNGEKWGVYVLPK